MEDVEDGPADFEPPAFAQGYGTAGRLDPTTNQDAIRGIRAGFRFCCTKPPAT
jgi:hypothetical protein